MLRNRKGVTLTEIMTVVAMAVTMTAIALPKLGETRRAASMQSARTQVESFLSVARSIAIRTGGKSYLIREGNTIRIMADSADAIVAVVRPVKLDSISHVTLDATADTIIFDSRGIATNLAAGGEKFYIKWGLDASVSDSICVTRLGMVLDRNCGLALAAKELPKDEELPPVDDGGGIVIDDPIIEPIIDPIIEPITDPLTK